MWWSKGKRKAKGMVDFAGTFTRRTMTGNEIKIRAVALLALVAMCGFWTADAEASIFWESGVNHNELDWKYVETEHFIIYWTVGNETTARMLYAMAEDAYDHLAEIYNFDLHNKITVTVLDTEDYSNGFAAFVYDWITIWSTNLYGTRRGRVDWVVDVFTHELGHIISLKAAGNFRENMYGVFLGGARTSRKYNFDMGVGMLYATERLPVWMYEGVSQHGDLMFGGDLYDSNREMLLRMAILEDHMLTMDQMDLIYEKISLQAEMCYNQAFSISTYISEQWGIDAIAKMWHEVGVGIYPNYNRMIKKELGITRDELYEQYKEYMTKKYNEQVKDIVGNEAKGKWLRLFNYHPPVEEMTDNDKWMEGQANYYVKYSPDGEWIALASSYATHGGYWTALYIRKTHPDPEKINDAKIIKVDSVYGSFDWSPDSKKIVYGKLDSEKYRGYLYSDLWVYDVEGKKSEQITHGARALNPAWNPVYDKIAFCINGDGSQRLAIMDFPGLSGHYLLIDYNDGTQTDMPAWSPDGRKLAFVMYRHHRQDVWTINMDGSGLYPVTYDDHDNRDPSWHPDGKHLFFASDRTGIFNIYKTNVQTHETTQITDVLGGAFMPWVKYDGSSVTYTYFTSWGFRPYEIQLFQWKNKAVADFEFNVTDAEVKRNLEVVDDLPIIVGRDYDVYEGFAQLLPIWSDHRGVWLWVPMVNYDDARLQVGTQIGQLDHAATNEMFMYIMVGEEQRYSVYYFNYMLPFTTFVSLHRILPASAEDFAFFDFDVKATFDVIFSAMGFNYLLFGQHDLWLYYTYQDYRVEQPSTRVRQVTGRALNLEYDAHKSGPYYVDRGINPRSGSNFNFGLTYSSPKLHEPITGAPMGTDLATMFQDPAVISLEEARHYPDEEYLLPDYGFIQARMSWVKHLPVPFWNLTPLNDIIPISGFDWEDLNLYKFRRMHHGLTLSAEFGYTHSTVPEGYGYGNSFGRVHFYDRFNGGGLFMTGMSVFSDNVPFLGYENYSLEGETKALLGYNYRLPLIREIDKVWWAFYFDKLYFGFFGNTGNYWSHVNRRKDMFDMNKVFDKTGDGKFNVNDDLISDAGIEIRLASYLFQSNWDSFIKVAHGFQDREREERPFRFYFGLGTGFDD